MEGATPYQSGLTGTSYTDTGTSSGTTYYYTLNAVNADDVSSSRTAEVSAAPLASSAALSSLTISPSSVTGGTSATGTVTLDNPAPSGGATVSLASDNAAATVPASVSIAAGANSATFPITTTAVTAQATANITASYSGVSKSAALTVNAPPVFQITGINNGDTISGDSSVGVNAYTEHGLLTFFVDGSEIGSCNVTFSPGQNKAGFSLETTAYPNGTHVLTVSDVRGNTDTRTVTFSNALSNVNYNPMFDSTPGVTDIANACHIMGTFSTPQPWTVNITDDSNNPIKSFSGSGTSVDVTWDGTDANGQSVPGDDYIVTITGSGTAAQSATGTGPSPQATAALSKNFIVNKDNYADSIIILHTETFGLGGKASDGGDGPVVQRAKAIAYKHFLHAELDRFVGATFNYPILVSIVSDYDFLHDPNLVRRIENKFRRPAHMVYIVADGNYEDPNAPPIPGTTIPDVQPVHPYFGLGSYQFFSGFLSGEMTKPNYIDVSALTAQAGYSFAEGPFVWINTCFATAGGLTTDPYNGYQSGQRDPIDYQWATDFGITGDFFGGNGGVYLGATDSIPRQYLPQLPGNFGADWSTWRQNFLDFFCAGGNNFQTALRRSYDVQSFFSDPHPEDTEVSLGYGYFGL